MIIENVCAKQGLFLTPDILYSCDGSACYKSDKRGRGQEKIKLENLEGLKLKFKDETLAYAKSNKFKAIYLPSESVIIEKNFKSTISSFCLSPSGANTAIGFDDGKVIIYSNLSGDILGKFVLFSDGSEVEHIDFLDDTMVLGATKENISIVNLFRKSVVLRARSKKDIKDLYCHKNKLVYTTIQNEICIFEFSDIRTPNESVLHKLAYEIKSIIFTNDGKGFFIATDDRLFFIDIESEKLTQLNDKFDPIFGIVLDKNDSLYITHEDSIEFIKNPFKLECYSPDMIEEDPLDKIDKTVRFLTVDDSKIIRLIISKSILNNFENVKVDEAEDGIEALSYLYKNPNIDVMFLDWNMPNMNGDKVVDEMAKEPKFKHIKIIMATTEGAKDRVKRMISKGVTGYLVKPLTAGNVNPLTKKIIKMVLKERLENV